MELLKKAVLTYFCVILLGLVWLSSGNAELYPRVAVVDDVDPETDIVLFVDGVGFIWEYEGASDWEVGDTVALMLDDSGTDVVYDDIR